MKYTHEEYQERINSFQELTDKVKAQFKNQFDVNIDPNRCQEIAMEIRRLSENSVHTVDKVFNDYFWNLQRKMNMKSKWKSRLNSFANSGFTKKKP